MRDHVVLCGPDVDGDYRDAETLRAGGVADAEAVAVLEEDGVGNVHAALGARLLVLASREGLAAVGPGGG